MNMQSKKERLDRIGQGVLEASRMPDGEIEEIVAAPHLFRSVQASIERERTAEISTNNGFRRRWSWQLKAAASTALAVGLGVTVGVVVYTGKTSTIPTSSVIHDQQDTAEYAPKPLVENQTIGAEESGRIDRPVTQRAALVESRAPQKHRTETIEEVSEFYPITYTDNQDSNDGGQLVRVELPRSSIAAMGIDPPVENESPKVKTDLLIGSDGVMKAVRFVK